MTHVSGILVVASCATLQRRELPLNTSEAVQSPLDLVTRASAPEHLLLTTPIDIELADHNTHLMSGDLIVLNGASSSGKTSLVQELQQLWPRPLFATGIDVIFKGWPGTFVLDDNEAAVEKDGDSLHIVAGLGPEPS